jgi:hypothetical protein
MESTLLWRGHPPKITVGIEVHQEVSRSTTTTTTRMPRMFVEIHFWIA